MASEQPRCSHMFPFTHLFVFCTFHCHFVCFIALWSIFWHQCVHKDLGTCACYTLLRAFKGQSILTTIAQRCLPYNSQHMSKRQFRCSRSLARWLISRNLLSSLLCILSLISNTSQASLCLEEFSLRVHADQRRYKRNPLMKFATSVPGLMVPFMAVPVIKFHSRTIQLNVLSAWKINLSLDYPYTYPAKQ